MYYYLDDLIIDTVKKDVWRSQVSLKVSGLNFEFFSFMLTKGTAVVTFDELIAGVWSPVVVNEDTVTQRVLLLRNALGDNGRNPRYVRSVRGQGYQLVDQPRTDTLPLSTSAIASGKPQPLVRLMASATLLGLVLALGSGKIGFGGAKQVDEAANNSSVSKLLNRAQYYLSIGQNDDNDRAIELFQKVLLLESKNIQATVGLSWAYTASMCRHNADRQLADQAETLAMNVIAIEPSNFAAFRALGYSQGCRGQTLLSEQSYMRAIELDPNNDLRSQSALAYSLGETGHLARALALNLMVSRADPSQTFTLIQLGRVYELLGLHSRAEPLFAESFELYPDNIFSNLSYPRHLFHQGRFSAARAAVTRAKTRPAHPDLLVLSAELALLDSNFALAKSELAAAAAMRPSAEYLSLLVKLYPSVQQPVDWLRVKIADTKPKESSDPEGWLMHALLYQALGEDQAGINALRSAVKSGYRNKNYLQLSPLFIGLRTNPEFSDITDRINLAVENEMNAVYASGALTQMVRH